MQPAPSLLALSIRNAFMTSKAVNRSAFSRCRPAHNKAAPQWRKVDLRCRRSFHSTWSSRIDEQGHKSERLTAPRRESSEAPPGQPTIEIPSPESASSPSTNIPPNGSLSNGENGTAEHLPSHAESRRSALSKRFTNLMDTFQSNVFVASQHLNDLTGYSGIEALKKSIEKQESRVQLTRAAVKTARDLYMAAVSVRSSSQREVNDLLQRKHAWSPTDLERFTSLYRSDHVNEQAEAKAQDDLGKAEREAEEAASKLARTILARYHEEQIWSDKIRRMSTWGTWGLMGLNVFLFLIFQIAVEPWRRRRLVKGFEDKVMEALEKENTNGHAAVTVPMDKAIRETETLPGTQPDSEQEDLTFAIEPTNTNLGSSSFTGSTMSTESPQTKSLSEPLLATTEQIPEELTPLQDLSDISTSSAKGSTPIKDASPPDLRSTSAFPIPSSISSAFSNFTNHLSGLFSKEITLTITKRDLTTKVLEGAVGGATVVGIMAACLLRGR